MLVTEHDWCDSVEEIEFFPAANEWRRRIHDSFFRIYGLGVLACPNSELSSKIMNVTDTW
jgi:hypothetical protein